MLGQILFAVVWILELVWNWMKAEWAKVNFNIQQERSVVDERSTDTKRRKEKRVKSGKRQRSRKTPQ